MPEDDLAYLCGRKYQLLAKMRSEGLSPSEMIDLSEIEAKITSAQKQEKEPNSSKLSTAIKKLIS